MRISDWSSDVCSSDLAKGSGSLSAVRLAQLDAKALDGELHAHADVSWHDGVFVDGAGGFRNLHPEILNAEMPGGLNGRLVANTTNANRRQHGRRRAQRLASKLSDKNRKRPDTEKR